MKLIQKEMVAEKLLTQEFLAVYKAFSQELQQLVTFDQFAEMNIAFNVDVQHYELAFQNEFQQLEQYIFLDNEKRKVIVVAFDRDGIIQGLYLKPYVTYPESDQRLTVNQYRMPICDEWVVFWGGTNEFYNYHYAYEHMRYAYDLVRVKDGSTYQHNPLRNENYYAFGADVIAPCSGQIVTVVNDLLDNVPGEMDEENAAGNYVVIAHEHEEYSMIAHLKQHSICVKTGDFVNVGQIIGRCGNSGNSSEAHIHFQVMDSPQLAQAKSIRIQFQQGHEPVQGDKIQPLLLK
ncbi:MAG: M23 family metallopeptidase [Solibacillus sp.]|uniref:M23 family metallopeptidase n=1 Tax=unclassified Solibacillus TaxID=2637870 RepID=UPI0030FCB607